MEGSKIVVLFMTYLKYIFQGKHDDGWWLYFK